jgi:hypothetical protein
MFVCDATNHIMPHGDSLSFGDIYLHNLGIHGYTIPQGALILPLPGSDNLFYIFHEKADWADPPNDIIVPGVQYSIVDMNQNQGKGDVIIKNQAVIRDTINYGNLCVVRHANGRDWWILAPGFTLPVIHKILFTPNGISTFKQTVPFIPSLKTESGQAVFTPDGSKYIRCSNDYCGTTIRLEVYSFDRCSGLLSNFQDIPGIMDSLTLFPGVAVSPNSQYLYVTNGSNVFQFDLFAPDIASTQQIVAVWDNFHWINTPTFFNNMQLAPDGRIYISAANVPYMHVINQPNYFGSACDVQQRAVFFPYVNNVGMPNFPNFRLGPMVGSPCDSLFNAIPESGFESEQSFTAYPNPCSDMITFNLGNEVLHKQQAIQIYNSIGQKLDEIAITVGESTSNYNTCKLADGIYYAVRTEENKVLNRLKFIILR